jgi:hypothetical protein
MLPSIKWLYSINTQLETILFLDELSQNRKKAQKFVPKLKVLGYEWWEGAYSLVFSQNGAILNVTTTDEKNAQ